MEDPTKKYYDQFGMNEWKRLESPSGQIEFAIFIEYINRYLKPTSDILDIGGGPGRYSIYFAQQGHKVALGDLSTELISIAKDKVKSLDLENSFICIEEMNIVDLSRFNDDTFDAVIAFGPFYHLINENDRDKAIVEIKRVLKSEGVLYVSTYTVYTWMNGMIDRALYAPQQVPYGKITDIYEKQVYLNPTGQGFTNGYYFYPDDFLKLFEKNRFGILELVSSKSIAFGKENELMKLKDERKEIYNEIMQLIFKTANDPKNLSNSGQIMLISKNLK